MFDPAVLGTLIIGLDAIRREDDGSTATVRPRRAQRRRTPLRQRMAAALRWTAARIEPAPTPAG